jgi:hypothetical protein
MNAVILLNPDPETAKETIAAVSTRVREAKEALTDAPVKVTIPEARVLVAMMNDMWARRDQSNLITTEPALGDEGTVFGYPYIVGPA